MAQVDRVRQPRLRVIRAWTEKRHRSHDRAVELGDEHGRAAALGLDVAQVALAFLVDDDLWHFSGIGRNEGLDEELADARVVCWFCVTDDQHVSVFSIVSPKLSLLKKQPKNPQKTP